MGSSLLLANGNGSLKNKLSPKSKTIRIEARVPNMDGGKSRYTIFLS